MIQLGVATKIMGHPKLQPPPAAAHLSVKLLALRDVLLYLVGQQVRCYRLPDTLVDAAEDARAWQRQLDSCAALLNEVGGLARTHGIRLTMHLPLHAALASPDDAVAAQASVLIGMRAQLLDALGCGPDGTLVAHPGGTHGDGRAARERFAARWERLRHATRRRTAIEPDEDCFDLVDLLPLHQMLGLQIVFDALHFQINNQQRLGLGEALGLALATWPPGVRPKVHVSTQRTEAHLRAAGRGLPQHVVPPRHGQHADFVNPFEFAALLGAARGLPPFDVMLEAKAGDLALLRLREDLARFAPEVAAGVC